MQTSIKVNSEAVERKLQQLASTLDGPRRKALMQVLGKGLETDLQAHFLRKNRKPNKRGFPKSNFWRRIRTATQFTGATQSNATVAIADPAFATHYHGATIQPRRAKYLAIPNTAEAYGSEPRSGRIDGLFFAQNKKGTKFLARKGAGGELEVHYFLKKRVRIPKDPTALPPRNVLAQATLQRARAHIARTSN